MCLLIINNLFLAQTVFAFSFNSECLSPQLSINSLEIKNSYLLSLPLATVTNQLFFTPTKRFLPFATRLHKFYQEENKMVQLQISSACPSKCILCAHGPENFSKHIKHMPFSEINRNLDILKAAGVKTVSLCLDFEPFYYYDNGKDISDVMKLIHSKGLDCWLISHGWEQGDLIPKKAAERLAALPFPVYVLISYHIWHNDVMSNPQSEQVKSKYIARFSEIIGALSINPQTGQKSKVQIEYRYVSDRMEKFSEINALQESVWQILKNRFDISDDIVDYEWGIEWSKGLAVNIAKKFNIEVPELFNNWGWLDRELQNIHFVIKIDGNMYVLAEALALERIDLEILMGALIEKGYSISEEPQKINEVFWYRILTPEETIIAMNSETSHRIKLTKPFGNIEQAI